MDTREKLAPCAEFLGRMGHALAAHLNLEHDKHIRYFAHVHAEHADNEAGFTLHPGSKSIGPGDDELCASPADALQPCDDGTLAVGIAVLELPPTSIYVSCAGFVFTIDRAEDGGHRLGAGRGSFSQACSTDFSNRVLTQGAFLATIR